MFSNDKVIEEIDKDKLFRGGEVENLAKVIQSVPKPFVISINGDWGTGKTSFVNLVENECKKISNSKFVTIDVWNYSKFMNEKNVIYNFISEITEKIIDNKKCIKRIKNSLKQIENIELGKEGVFKMTLKKNSFDMFTEVRKIKENLEKAIKKEIEKNKPIVIFVDNLDRLSPDLSVELLEVIHLILDLPHCVFILAIDYEVIVKGYHKKMGDDMSLQKAKDYFDKIIQLSIDLPSLSYENEMNFIESRIRESITDISVQEKMLSKKIYNVLKISTNTNPRKISRVLNYFNFSINKIKENTDINYTILLCFICLKHEFQEIYNLYKEVILGEDGIITGMELFDIFLTITDTTEEQNEFTDLRKRIEKIISVCALEKRIEEKEVMDNIDTLLSVVHTDTEGANLKQVLLIIEDSMYESDKKERQSIPRNELKNDKKIPEKTVEQSMGKYVVSTIELANLTYEEITEMTKREFSRIKFQTSTPVFRDVTEVSEEKYDEERFKVLDKPTKYARYYKNPVKLKVKNSDDELILLLSSQWGDYQYEAYREWLLQHL